MNVIELSLLKEKRETKDRKSALAASDTQNSKELSLTPTTRNATRKGANLRHSDQ